jgi:hypothetical protein
MAAYKNNTSRKEQYTEQIKTREKPKEQKRIIMLKLNLRSKL